MKIILIREIVFTLLVILQFTVTVYYRNKVSNVNRPISTGKKDMWLSVRNSLIIFTVLMSFFSIDTILPNVFTESIVLVSTICGTIVWLCSIWLYIWSRNVLNTHFNSSAVIYENHELITSGPYSVSRHPIYLSYLGTFIGVILLTFSLFAVIGGGIGAGWMLTRISSEEQILVAKFGNTYIQYQKKTGMLLPKIRTSSEGT